MVIARPTPNVATFSRREFLEERWQYKAGDHLTILGPTGTGKTYLFAQLLERSASRDLKAIVLVVKPKDATIDEWKQRLRLPVIRDWPPNRAEEIMFRDRIGWIVWPRHSFDPQKDDKRLYEVHRKAILAAYKHGQRILIADETYALAKELGLERELIALWSRGRSMGVGLWAGTQRPSRVPLWAYDQAWHLFLANDPDARARERYDEIGGIDPDIVEDLVLELGRHEFLYIRRDGPVVCKITAT